jgi:hypothetical protein
MLLRQLTLGIQLNQAARNTEAGRQPWRRILAVGRPPHSRYCLRRNGTSANSTSVAPGGIAPSCRIGISIIRLAATATESSQTCQFTL